MDLAKRKVTVVIPVFNRENYLPAAIESVLSQTFEGWKMIIIDDASTDKSRDVALEYATDPRIKYIRMKKNVGTGKVLSLALRHIKTKYFMILDSDDWLEPKSLDVLVNAMDREPKTTSLAYGNAKQWLDPGDQLYLRKVIKHRIFHDKYDFMMYRRIPCPRFFRTKWVLKVGGFELDDPSKGRYLEDRYLLLKLISVSDFLWINQHLYNIRKHSNNITGIENRPKINEVRKFVYSKMLNQWGNEYEPVFQLKKSGWLSLQELKPIVKNDEEGM